MKTNRLYTLTAMPNTPAEYLVMIADLDTVAGYLGCSPAFKVLMHQQAAGTGESVFAMDGTSTGRTGRVGSWRLLPGAHLPMGVSVERHRAPMEKPTDLAQQVTP